MSLVVRCSDGIVVHVDKDIITKFSIGFQKKLAGMLRLENNPLFSHSLHLLSILWCAGCYILFILSKESYCLTMYNIFVDSNSRITSESESETAPIIIDNVNSRSLLKVVEYCTVHNDPSISATDLKAWDNKFVKVEPSVLCELASVTFFHSPNFFLD